MKKADFTKELLRWNKKENTRSMPWKGEKDPYRIWLSEIILQQTRVEQGWAYYERFIAAFPDVRSLAAAPENKVFKLWEGLGYYNRCRNLIETARRISGEYGGVFPAAYEDIRALKGIGPYTAAAIASFAFGLPYAVVDGNVERVLSRYFGISTPVDTAAGKAFYASLAAALLDRNAPGIYNQAIMDFGALVCKPQQPLCQVCVQRKDCQAYLGQMVSSLPVKKKSLDRKTRWFYYYIVNTQAGVFIRQRQTRDIWQHLYEFPLVENTQPLDPAQIRDAFPGRPLFAPNNIRIREVSPPCKQQLTHQTIQGQFIHVELKGPVANWEGYQLVPRHQLGQYPFPRLITSYLSSQAPLLP